MGWTTIEVLVLLAMILANGVFAMSEIAVVSARQVRLQRWAKDGNANARVALRLATAPNRFLSTVQIGITLVGITAGAFGGATLSDDLAGILDNVKWLSAYSHAISVGVIVLATTYLSLVVGELVPKRLALLNPERVACAIAKPMERLSIVTGPIVSLLTVSTDFLLRLVGSRSVGEPTMTEEEIKVLFQQATKAGVFAESEQDMVEGVLELGDMRMGALMTPRTDVVWLDVGDPVHEIIDTVVNAPHDFFPVCQDNLDNVVGVLSAKEYLGKRLTEPSTQLKTLLHPPLFVPESIRASALLDRFKQTGIHLAMILDEYGGLQGIVTLNDVMEEIVGEIERSAPQATERTDGSWLFDGLLPVDEFKKTFNLKRLPGEGHNNYETLGGFVMMLLGRIPRTADTFRWGGLNFEIVDMDGKRIDKMLVTPIKPASTQSKVTDLSSPPPTDGQI